MKGHFITLEGGEGSGKSTLIRSLYSALTKRGLSALQTHAPGGTTLGKTLRKLLLTSKENIAKTSELFLFLADRAQHVKEVIEPALEQGKIVLCDRFSDSTIAYQGGPRGFEMQKVEELCQFASGGLEPDLTLYLDIDPVIGLERVKKLSSAQDRIESETLEFHQEIRKAFLKLAKQYPSRIQTIDATGSKQSVADQALRLIDVHCPVPNA